MGGIGCPLVFQGLWTFNPVEVLWQGSYQKQAEPPGLFPGSSIEHLPVGS